MKLFRQGDVLLQQVKSFPEVCSKKGDNVIAYGEATGHSHRLLGDALLLLGPEGELFAEVLKQSQVVHEEHETLNVPEGVYKIVFEKEYDPFEEEIRRVRD